MASVKQRVGAWVEHDWMADAETLMQEREATGGKVRIVF